MLHLLLSGLFLLNRFVVLILKNIVNSLTSKLYDQDFWDPHKSRRQSVLVYRRPPSCPFIHRPAVLLLQRQQVRVGLVALDHADGGQRIRPHGGDVVVAGLLVQPAPLVLAAEAVVARAAAVDVAALGAVEGGVEVAHHVVVTPVGGGRGGLTRRCRRRGLPAVKRGI